MAGEELCHIRSRRRHTWEGVDSRAAKDESQNALMLVEGPGLESLLSRGTDDQSGDLSTAVADVGLIPFIEGDDQQALTLKRWAGHQRGNADGSALVYSTYLGGSSDFNFGQSIAWTRLGAFT